MEKQAVSDWRSEVQRRRAMLLDYMLLAGTALGFLAIFALYFFGLEERGWRPLERSDLFPFLAGWVVVLAAWLWRGLGYRIRTGVLLLLVYLFGSYLLSLDGLSGGGRIWLVLLLALTFVLAGQWPGLVAGGVSILTYAFFTVTSELINPWLSEAPDFLIGVVGLAMVMWAFNRGWMDALTQASAANTQLQAQTETLQETTKHLQATAAVAHACSSILDPETLIFEVVNQIQREFGGMGVYYVGMFLLDSEEDDSERRSAVLRAATGSVGRKLLDQGYTVALDGTSAVGRCITQRQSVVASSESTGLLPGGSLLEGARSGAALPLRSRGRILGALSVQSTREGIFVEEVVGVLEAMADQLAVALDNARLFAQTEAALKEVQAAQRRYLAQAWKEFLSIRPVSHVDYVQPGAEVGEGGGQLLRDARRAALVHERAVAMDISSAEQYVGELDKISSQPSAPSSLQTVLAVPLKLRGQVIGTLSLHETRRRRPWTVEEIALAETVAEQVALTAENLRLMDEAQRRVAREQARREATDTMRRSVDIDALMKATVGTVTATLGAAGAFVHLSVAPESEDDGRGDGG
ncbi:MAG: GAF domain-containing protein [Anaerolineae bacterium]|nr:GAF domain-containing protein [Anaerolineae bacterium]